MKKKNKIKIKMKKFFPQKKNWSKILNNLRRILFNTIKIVICVCSFTFQHMVIFPADNTNTNASATGSILLVQAFCAFIILVWAPVSIFSFFIKYLIFWYKTARSLFSSQTWFTASRLWSKREREIQKTSISSMKIYLLLNSVVHYQNNKNIVAEKSNWINGLPETRVAKMKNYNINTKLLKFILYCQKKCQKKEEDHQK